MFKISTFYWRLTCTKAKIFLLVDLRDFFSDLGDKKPSDKKKVFFPEEIVEIARYTNSPY